MTTGSATAAMLPYSRQSIAEADIEAVVAALRGPLLTGGPAVDTFERRLRDVCGAPNVVACSSGTAALHLTLAALDLGPGGAAIVPSITFLATANAARFLGAEVVFADVDPDTGLMRPEDIDSAAARARRRGSEPKVVLPVHLAGQPGDLAAISELAGTNGWRVVEDACHALGSEYDGHKVGACAHSALATFSFHPVKAIATGEGGAVTTRDPDLAMRVRRLREHGMVRDSDRFRNMALAFGADGSANPWYYEMPEIGFNYRISDIQCALGISQLDRLGRFVQRRRTLAARYDSLFRDCSIPVRPIARQPGAVAAWHLYVVLIDFDAAGVDRATVMRRLRSQGIVTQVHYVPVHLQPYYRDRYGEEDLPGANRYYARCLSLPLFPDMTDDDVDRVVEALSNALC